MNLKSKTLHMLVKQWTRAEIMARHGEYDSNEYFQIMLDKENEIRELLYGSSNLVKLGKRWRLLK